MTRKQPEIAAAHEDGLERGLKVHLTLVFDDVHWPQVLELLMRRYRMGFSEASALIGDFWRRYKSIFPVSWFIRSALSQRDNLLICAIGECHGADTIALVCSRQLRVGPLGIEYQQHIRFSPNFKRREGSASGTQHPTVSVRLFAKRLRIDSLGKMLSLYFMFLVIAAFSAALLMGALLYSLAVFLVFIEEPSTMTSTATRNGPIGLALLCFLVAAAGLCGRALFNLARVLLSRAGPGLAIDVGNPPTARPPGSKLH